MTIKEKITESKIAAAIVALSRAFGIPYKEAEYLIRKTRSARFN